MAVAERGGTYDGAKHLSEEVFVALKDVLVTLATK